jgi:hypothetical protein
MRSIWLVRTIAAALSVYLHYRAAVGDFYRRGSFGAVQILVERRILDGGRILGYGAVGSFYHQMKRVLLEYEARELSLDHEIFQERKKGTGRKKGTHLN